MGRERESEKRIVSELPPVEHACVAPFCFDDDVGIVELFRGLDDGGVEAMMTMACSIAIVFAPTVAGGGNAKCDLLPSHKQTGGVCLCQPAVRTRVKPVGRVVQTRHMVQGCGRRQWETPLTRY